MKNSVVSGNFISVHSEMYVWVRITQRFRSEVHMTFKVRLGLKVR